MPLLLSGGGQPQPGEGRSEDTQQCQRQMVFQPALINELLLGKLLLLPLHFFEGGEVTELAVIKCTEASSGRW